MVAAVANPGRQEDEALQDSVDISRVTRAIKQAPAQGEAGELTNGRFEIEVGVRTDQIDLEQERLADGLAAFKPVHMEIGVRKRVAVKKVLCLV